ncbi:MAG: DUF4271 domain-containing protein [Bacteroidetes bacterium]|nr:DUF4271 domain-containing protein [Bacteroidota bacterium]
MTRLSLLCFVLLCCSVRAQDQNPSITVEPSVNVDSIILDSMRKAYILNHKPLTKTELSQFASTGKNGVYGVYIQPFIDQSESYPFPITSAPVHAPRIRRQHTEWIFYSFCFLLLYAAIINRYSNQYVRQMFRAFFDDGFIFRQVKDQLTQMPYVAFFFNLLFLITGSLFFYFGLEWDVSFFGWKRWLLLGGIAVFLLFIYGFKSIFMRMMGWAFDLRDSFNNYIFVISLQNKLLSLFLLFTSFIIAFSATAFSAYVFKIAVVLLVLSYVYRLIRGFQIFTTQARMQLFSVALAFVSLEALPTALLIKFLSRTVSLVVEGWM